MINAILACSGCGIALSGPVTVCAPASPEEAGLQFQDGQPLTRPGEVFTANRPIRRSLDERYTTPLQFAPQHWMQPDDVDAAVEPVLEARRLNGCCGLDGLDGPNMRCRGCGAVVGTRMSDCWTPDVFIPEPGRTEWKTEGA